MKSLPVRAKEAGRKAFLAGERREINPFSNSVFDTDLAPWWDAGWIEASEIASEESEAVIRETEGRKGQ